MWGRAPARWPRGGSGRISPDPGADGERAARDGGGAARGPAMTARRGGAGGGGRRAGRRAASGGAREAKARAARGAAAAASGPGGPRLGLGGHGREVGGAKATWQWLIRD